MSKNKEELLIKNIDPSKLLRVTEAIKSIGTLINEAVNSELRDTTKHRFIIDLTLRHNIEFNYNINLNDIEFDFFNSFIIGMRRRALLKINKSKKC